MAHGKTIIPNNISIEKLKGLRERRENTQIGV